jgi:putative ABC transport system permease protein
MSELRTKEIAVRKIMGATVRAIVQTLSREFVILVAIANVLAFVPAWFILNNWLNSFAYRINLSLLTFVLAAVLSFVTALVTVSFNTLKAAMINPATALKYE